MTADDKTPVLEQALRAKIAGKAKPEGSLGRLEDLAVQPLEQIGQHFGITKERVRQINVRGMKQLRDRVSVNRIEL